MESGEGPKGRSDGSVGRGEARRRERFIRKGCRMDGYRDRGVEWEKRIELGIVVVGNMALRMMEESVLWRVSGKRMKLKRYSKSGMR